MSNPLNAALGNSPSGVGPSEFPTNSVHENPGKPGNVFGDKSPRTPISTGSDLARGLSCCMPFHDESPESLGEGRDVSTGKPDGPQMGKVNNGGAGSKLSWG
jgi:hypothetical protein